MRAGFRFYTTVLILFIVVMVTFSPLLGIAHAQEEEPDISVSPEVEGLMALMTPEEKVGQLFLVNFVGNDVSPGSDVSRLIQEKHIGGVVLSPANRNFVNDETGPQQVAELANELQALAFTNPLSGTQPVTTTTQSSIPLFVALNEEGDGYPYSSLWEGVTPLPNAMAVGATWKPLYAQQVGQIVGQELEVIGVNMLLGPSLDVADRPRPDLHETLGTRSFGGDPYWVGELGQSYIRGVHEGSGGRVLVVAKHFPGLGGVDRNPDEELPTIQKTLDAMRSVELVPFFTVTALDAENKPFTATTDALMTSHVRYRGFQGNIRQLTRPISCDAQNLPAILSLPEFAPWRENGGLLVSNSLGVPSIHKFYDPTLETFPAKRIAQEAFLAGNDLLYLSDFDLSDDWGSQLENIESTILFFEEKYESDPTFQERVDQSVARILQKKIDASGEFDLENILVPVDQVAAEVGQQEAEIGRLAQESATLIYPDLDELSGRLPSPPLSDDNILLITDDRQGQDCPECAPHYFIDPQALATLMLELYGPEATGQISAEQVNSMTFGRLKRVIASSQALVDEQAPQPATTKAMEEEEQLLRDANWIIFAMLDVDTANYPDSDALKVFLRERSDNLQGKTLIVLAFNAPYYLDTTEVSKLTAYYGLYSKTTPFMETAVRLLFQEFQPHGASPVNIEAIGYELIEVTRPDPNQVINIEVVTDTVTAVDTLTPTPAVSAEGTPVPIQLNLKVGDQLTLRAGKILDYNGRPVPDGTPVEFRLVDTLQGLEARLPSADTVDGVATTNFSLDRSGVWQITASSDTATRSVAVIVTIPEEGLVEVGYDRPTSTATATSTPTATPSPTPSSTPSPTPTETRPPPTVTPTITPSPTASPSAASSDKTVNVVGLLFSMVCLMLVGGGIYLSATRRLLSPDDRIFHALTAMVSGLVGYVLFGAGLIPLERLPFIARAIQTWLPPEILPVAVSLVFAAIGPWAVALIRTSMKNNQ